MLRILFEVRGLRIFIIYLCIRTALYVTSYSDYAEVHKHYFCMRAAST